MEPHRTIRTYLRNPKDKIKLENHGVYSISCGTCNKTYVGQTNRRISARLEEHKLSIRNRQTSSALFQHHLNTGHKINLDSCKQIANADHFRTRIIREAIEIEKSGSLNRRDDAANLPTTWKTLIKPKKEDNTHSEAVETKVNRPAVPSETLQGAELIATN
ncbi:MAG: GIY-YIG nuclease family protein, partial [Wolbachia endosymbiont of Pissodes strobi]|nr:GIY-YIG nuclease family protein [Wolbachia endosymbiont of Pissodes strobi]